MISKSSQGSTIIEAMIAVVILGCALVAVIPSYVSVISAAKVQEQYAQALIFLENEFASRIARGFVNKDLNERQRHMVDGTAYEVHSTARKISGRDIDLLTISVQWKARSIEVATYLFDAAEKKDRQDAFK